MGIKELFKRKNKEQKEIEKSEILETNLPLYHYKITKKVIPLINQAVKNKEKTLIAKIPFFGECASEGYGLLDDNAELYIEPVEDEKFALRLYVDWYGKNLAYWHESKDINELKVEAINQVIYASNLYKIRMERPLEDLEKRIRKL